MELLFAVRVAGKYFARYSEVQTGSRKGHIRNASSGQWRQRFYRAIAVAL